MQDSLEVDWVCSTGGDGFWSRRAAPVKITRLELAYVADDGRFGELQAKFDPVTWDTDRDSLIYTDRTWMAAFQVLLESLGFPDVVTWGVGYSEAGMQGDDFVSMDVGYVFLEEWKKRFP